MQPQLIIDTMPFVASITEAAEGGGLRMRGVCQRAGIKNGNGRIYEEKVLRRAVERISESIKRRRVTGELDHPSYSEVRLGKASHIITALEMQDNGEVVCELEILEDSPYGKQAASLARKMEMGISSRGRGSTKIKDGIEYIGEDFELDTFDLVSNPSTKGAWMSVVRESQDTQTGEDTPSMDTKARYKDLKSQAESLLAQNPATLSESSRRTLAEQAEQVVEGLDRLVIDDKGLSSNVGALVHRLHERVQYLNSADAPPPVERQTEAAEQIIEEMMTQFAEREGVLVTEARRLLRAANERARRAESQANQLARRNRRLRVEHSVALEAGEQLLEKVRGKGVREHVAALLAKSRNAFLRPVAETLRECKTVAEVDRKVEQFTRAIRRSQKVVEEIRSSSGRRRSALRESEVERRAGRPLREEDSSRDRQDRGGLSEVAILENMRLRTTLKV